MSNEMMRQEIWEAIDAGERALQSLNDAREKLNSAKTWGWVDLFGGGFITDMIKYSRMNDASRCLEDAKHHLHIFQKELWDVEILGNIRLDVGDFLTFADFFFDGVVADYLVQSKIGTAKREVEDAIQKVQQLLNRLKGFDGQEVE